MSLARPAVVLLLLAPLCACGTSRVTRVDRDIDRGELSAAPDPARDRQVHRDLIRRMLDQGQYYAALAHIESQARQSGPTEELRLLEAEARRKLGQTAQAQQIYQGLLKTQFDGEACHGIGLIAISTDPNTALAYLRRAVQLRPTDVQMRNDLGYALMLNRRYPEALPEIATAVELDPSSDKSRNNLIILMMLMRDETSVQRVAKESGVDAATLAGLRKQAQHIAAQKRPAPATNVKTPPAKAASG